MLLSAVSVLVVAQSSSEIPEGLMDNPVHWDEINRLIATVQRRDVTCKGFGNYFLKRLCHGI